MRMVELRDQALTLARSAAISGDDVTASHLINAADCVYSAMRDYGYNPLGIHCHDCDTEAPCALCQSQIDVEEHAYAQRFLAVNA